MEKRQFTEIDAHAVLRVIDHDLRFGVVAPTLRRFEIGLNKARWNGDTAPVERLRRLAIAQMGTANTLNERLFVEKLSKTVITNLLPAVFLSVSALVEEPHKTELVKAAELCETEGTSAAARSAATQASKLIEKYVKEYSVELASVVASYAADAAEYLEAIDSSQSCQVAHHATARSVDRAADALVYAADAVYLATHSAAAAQKKTILTAFWAAKNRTHEVANEADAAALAKLEKAHSDAVARTVERSYAASNQLLAQFAEEVVQILITMKTPGSEFLYLTQSSLAL